MTSSMRVTWVQPEDLVRHELWQSAREGRDVSQQHHRWVDAGGTSDPPYVGASPEVVSPALRDLATILIGELDALPETGVEREPSDWIDIQATIEAQQPSAEGSRPGDVYAEPGDDYADRIRGAWVGRTVGCVLGKPVEKIPREGIEAILRNTGRWPLDRWFTGVGLDPAVSQRWPWNKASRPTSLEENLDGTPEDDDLNYTILALRLVEQHGAEFTADDVARMWLLDLPAGRTFTAERVAYRNLLEGVTPPATARVRNPFREWIGAQIRTDLYGWVNPGNPTRAAEWAWRDASVSHTRNGLYGAMFVAAMASEAVRGSAVDTVLDVGASVVPAGSRMAAAIALGRELGRSASDPTDAYAALEAEFTGMHWVHSLNNTALVAFALQAGQGDFDRSICLTVMGGWDTDSSGATVGSVTGAITGARAIHPRWSDPLRGGLTTSIPDAGGLSFDELAHRTCAAAERVRP
ncbi:ADP-ribosylglycohydrolase family protein [Lapillicoccus sp.]|uniref:ADP-ribosylglycohydrolase family protein n=1 Tax=Lapillicoccus sp. TaxID=1909287 RepID=UPI003266D5BB